MDTLLLGPVPSTKAKGSPEQAKWIATSKKRARRVFKHHGLDDHQDWSGHTLLFPVNMSGDSPTRGNGGGLHWVLVAVSVKEGGIAMPKLLDPIGNTASQALKQVT